MGNEQIFGFWPAGIAHTSPLKRQLAGAGEASASVLQVLDSQQNARIKSLTFFSAYLPGLV